MCYLILQTAQVWETNCFRCTSMYELGQRVNVGHPGGSTCPKYKPGSRTFTLIDVHGIHRVSVDFCNCAQHVDHWRQLMRLKWWPASTVDPHTAVTFDCLRHFEKMNAQGHITATDYYRSLAQMTDPHGLVDLPVSTAHAICVSMCADVALGS
jgi:hypothetical protein